MTCFPEDNATRWIMCVVRQNSLGAAAEPFGSRQSRFPQHSGIWEKVVLEKCRLHARDAEGDGLNSTGRQAKGSREFDCPGVADVFRQEGKTLMQPCRSVRRQREQMWSLGADLERSHGALALSIT